MDWKAHYDEGFEQGRLSAGAGQLEQARTRELLERFLPAAPARIYDVGGGPGVYASWLTEGGYEVHLLDPVELHVEQASARSIASATVGDARDLPFDDDSADVVLMLGPLYHLSECSDRLAALEEARRVCRPGGTIAAAAISRYASTLDGLHNGWLGSPDFRKIVDRDLAEGQHRNPTADPRWFATAYFHRPEDLREEVEAAGLSLKLLAGIEGPGWKLPDLDQRWADADARAQVLEAARLLESEPSVLGYSAHLLAVASPR